MSLKILVNAVDQPGDCNFIMPSIVRQGDLQIAISTAGKSPALAKRLRKEMESMFGPEYDSFIDLFQEAGIEVDIKERPPSQIGYLD